MPSALILLSPRLFFNAYHTGPSVAHSCTGEYIECFITPAPTESAATSLPIGFGFCMLLFCTFSFEIATRSGHRLSLSPAIHALPRGSTDITL